MPATVPKRSQFHTRMEGPPLAPYPSNTPDPKHGALGCFDAPLWPLAPEAGGVIFAEECEQVLGGFVGEGRQGAEDRLRAVVEERIGRYFSVCVSAAQAGYHQERGFVRDELWRIAVHQYGAPSLDEDLFGQHGCQGLRRVILSSWGRHSARVLIFR